MRNLLGANDRSIVNVATALRRAAFYRSARTGDLRVHASRASNEHMSCYLRAGHYSLPDLLYFMLRGWTCDSFGADRTPVTSLKCVPTLRRSSLVDTQFNCDKPFANYYSPIQTIYNLENSLRQYSTCNVICREYVLKHDYE